MQMMTWRRRSLAARLVAVAVLLVVATSGVRATEGGGVHATKGEHPPVCEGGDPVPTEDAAAAGAVPVDAGAYGRAELRRASLSPTPSKKKKKKAARESGLQQWPALPESEGRRKRYVERGATEVAAWERSVGATAALRDERRWNVVDDESLVNKAWGSPGAFSPAMLVGGTTVVGGVPRSPPVEVVVFSDYQCPNCARVVEPAKLLARKFPGEVRVTWKHLALSSHKRAGPAAVAACAAGRQNAFWAYNDLLFASMRKLSDEDFERHARALDLDMEQFSHDVADSRPGSCRAQVEYETQVAGAMGITGTPGIVVNGEIQQGWASYSLLETTFERRRRIARAAKALAKKKGKKAPKTLEQLCATDDEHKYPC